MDGFFWKAVLDNNSSSHGLLSGLGQPLSTAACKTGLLCTVIMEECNDSTLSKLGLLKLASALLTVTSTIKIIHLDTRNFVHLYRRVCYWYLATKRQEEEWKISKQFDLKNSKKVKCALLQTSFKPVCLTENLHLVMTPSDDGWNKMFSKSPQMGWMRIPWNWQKCTVS